MIVEGYEDPSGKITILTWTKPNGNGMHDYYEIIIDESGIQYNKIHPNGTLAETAKIRYIEKLY